MNATGHSGEGRELSRENEDDKARSLENREHVDFLTPLTEASASRLSWKRSRSSYQKCLELHRFKSKKAQDQKRHQNRVA